MKVNHLSWDYQSASDLLKVSRTQTTQLIISEVLAIDEKQKVPLFTDVTRDPQFAILNLNKAVKLDWKNATMEMRGHAQFGIRQRIADSLGAITTDKEGKFADLEGGHWEVNKNSNTQSRQMVPVWLKREAAIQSDFEALLAGTFSVEGNSRNSTKHLTDFIALAHQCSKAQALTIYSAMSEADKSMLITQQAEFVRLQQENLSKLKVSLPPLGV